MRIASPSDLSKRRTEGFVSLDSCRRMCTPCTHLRRLLHPRRGSDDRCAQPDRRGSRREQPDTSTGSVFRLRRGSMRTATTSFEVFRKRIKQASSATLPTTMSSARHGVAYEGRGFDRQTGANGTKWANRHYAAICFMGGTRPAPGTKEEELLSEIEQFAELPAPVCEGYAPRCRTRPRHRPSRSVSRARPRRRCVASRPVVHPRNGSSRPPSRRYHREQLPGAEGAPVGCDRRMERGSPWR
jgi:hypothetical protein